MEQEGRRYGFTSTLLVLLREYATTGDLDQVEQLLEHYCAVIREDLAEVSSRADYAPEAHAALDYAIHQDQGRDEKAKGISCRAGCCHCCRQAVVVTRFEAERLVQVAMENDLPLDAERLLRQSACTEETWHTQPPSDRDCVFLGEEGRCTVYTDRPMSCRKYFSVDEPELCNIQKHPKGRVRTWFSFHAEALATAAFTEDESGFMPEQLLKVMAERNTL